jgi:hypothetical protein
MKIVTKLAHRFLDWLIERLGGNQTYEFGQGPRITAYRKEINQKAKANLARWRKQDAAGVPWTFH